MRRMRWVMAGLLGAIAAACAPGGAEGGADASGWRPTPVASAMEPSAVVASSRAEDWRPIDPENLMLIRLGDGGLVAIELAPAFAPIHVANIRAFARAGWWNGARIYRVQDNYVAQWGNGDADIALPEGVVRTPPAEYERALHGLSVRPLGFPDSYAPLAGHADGWPLGYDPGRGRVWLAHCYASVGVGRDLAPDTGTGGELYAVIGHGPRHLDRNIASVGRVVAGIDRLSALPRGTGNLGFYEDAERQAAPIASVAIAADLPEAQRPAFEVMRTDSAAFADYVRGRANRGGDFFQEPAGGVDLCNVGVPVRQR